MQTTVTLICMWHSSAVHQLNVYASKAAKGSIADFVGYIEVGEHEATTKLTQGVWLVRQLAHTDQRQC